MPMTPKTPATRPMAADAGSGPVSFASSQRAAARTMPMTWTTNETPRTAPRRLAQPPPKSPAPHEIAEARPKATTDEPPSRSGVGRASGARSREIVDLRRAAQRHDGVRRPVVTIRGRQVDDLEVAGDVAQELEGAGRPGVIERDERVVEDERRPAVPCHQPDQPDPGDEVDQVERPLAERGDVDPVAALRREHLDVERLVVDRDPAVAAASDPLDVADHLAFEIAGRRFHRRLLGPLDRTKRSLQDPGSALEPVELLAPRRQALAVSGDLLGVDAVRLDPGP